MPESEPAPPGTDPPPIVAPPAVSLPKGGGAIAGIGEKFAANPATGTATLSVPVAVSPSRGGANPDLTLTYDSGNGNGVFGFGWTLGLPSVSRRTDRGIPRYPDDRLPGSPADTFVLAGAEDLVPLADSDGTPAPDESVTVGGRDYAIRCYRPRVEGLFARIERWTPARDPGRVFWRTLSRDNVTTWFGLADTARIADPGRPGRIFQWLVSRTHDDKGNVTEFSYTAEDRAGVPADVAESHRTGVAATAMRYPARIRYGNLVPYAPALSADPAGWPEPDDAAGQAWMFEIRFDYTAAGDPSVAPARDTSGDTASWAVRTDPFSSYRSGFEVRTYRLCRRILMYHRLPPFDGPAVLVRSTDLDHDRPAPLDPANGGYSLLRSISHRSWEYDEGGALRSATLPPVGFGYSSAELDPVPRTVPASDMPGLPDGVHGAGLRWVDLDGVALNGVLVQGQDGAWLYAANRGDARFAVPRPVAPAPVPAGRGTAPQLVDLTGDGRLDVVVHDGATLGFYRRDGQTWTPHVSFAAMPARNLTDPGLRWVDLTGDGAADLLLTEDEALLWHPSAGEAGFDGALRVPWPADEADGPRLLLNDGTRAVFLADMTGDGLADLVRIRARQVCYWPSLGHGRFGRRVTMANPPSLGGPDDFDPSWLRLADVDGSGPADLLQITADGARIFLNRSGNGFSDGRAVLLPPGADRAAFDVLDLFGTGTACLVAGAAPPGADVALRYVDLMAAGKPHLLTSTTNNRGGSTTVEYAPSTRFHLDDLAAGRPWRTRLPFPVHCVSRITVRDRWRGTTYSSRFRYHDGCFDGPEREFRGFGCVEQVDVEEFDDPLLDQPPVCSVTWFHTGTDEAAVPDPWFPGRWRDRLTDGSFREAAPEPSSLAPDIAATERREALRALKGSELRREVYELAAGSDEPVRLLATTSHAHEVVRLQARAGQPHGVFLAGVVETLHHEYDLDLTAASVQPDPRVSHTLVLRRDELGTALQTIEVGYGRTRRAPVDELPGGVPGRALIDECQAETHVVYHEVRSTEDVEVRATPGASPVRHRRLRLPCENRRYELAGFAPRPGAGVLTRADLAGVVLSEHYGPQPGAPAGAPALPETPYHQRLDPQRRGKRPIHQSRVLYLDDASDADAPAAALPFGRHGPRGLAAETFTLALTDGLLDAVFAPAGQVPDPLLDWEVLPARDGGAATTARDLLRDPGGGGYRPGGVVGAPDEQLWIGSGRPGYPASPLSAFFQPDRYISPFGARTEVTYGAGGLFVESSTDARGNTARVVRFDHRILAPAELIDQNGRHSEVAFDVHGRAIAAAVKGMPRGGGWEGDDLAALAASYALRNPGPQLVEAFSTAAQPDMVAARTWLAGATTRILHDLGGRPGQWELRMPSVCSISRERHRDAATPLSITLQCSDGSGRVLMTKAQAEPAGPGGPPRWIVNGLTVLNNKGNPVQQFEPAFAAQFGPELPQANGVSRRFRYDGVGRQVRTDDPDGTHSRQVRTPWLTESWDPIDTVLESLWVTLKGRDDLPLADPLPVGPDNLVSADPEQLAGWQSRRHAGTPERTVLDSLGRPVLRISHTRVADLAGAFRVGGVTYRDDFLTTFTRLDAQGAPLWIRDPRGNLAVQHLRPARPVAAAGEQVPADAAPGHDLAGRPLYQRSMDAGERWLLLDAAGQPLLSWDRADRRTDAGDLLPEFRVQAIAYDVLRRPVARWLRGRDDAPGAAGPAPVMIERMQYQDAADGIAAADDRDSLNGQLVHFAEPSGVTTTVRRDLAGRIVQTARRLVRDPETAALDWSAAPVTGGPDPRLEDQAHVRIVEYDALGRPRRMFAWHRETTRDALGREQPTPGRSDRVAVHEADFNERGLLRAVTVHLRAGRRTAPDGTAQAQTAGAQTQAVIREQRYDVQGRPARVQFGNGTVTEHTYDPQTFRLVRTLSSGGLQDLRHTYDAGGGLIRVADLAQADIFFRNARVPAVSEYGYDALGRLVEATGREQAAAPAGVPEGPWPRGPVPTDATLRRYQQRFGYDRAGNLVRITHQAPGGRWVRTLQAADDGNRIVRSWEGAVDWDDPQAAAKVEYTSDAHGNLLNLNRAPDRFGLRWDHRDLLHQVDLGGGGVAHYQYDTGRERSRKFLRRIDGSTEERISFGDVERYRRVRGGRVVEEVETHVVSAGERQVLRADDVLIAPGGGELAAGVYWRYQFGDRVGSVTIELDDAARLISHEEFHPFGTSAYRVLNAAIRAPAKRFRYTGVERDEETGLDRHGARYRVPHLGRWASADPSGIAGGANLYAYAAGDPVRHVDPGGRQPAFTDRTAQGEVLDGGVVATGAPLPPPPAPVPAPVNGVSIQPGKFAGVLLRQAVFELDIRRQVDAYFQRPLAERMSDEIRYAREEAAARGGSRMYAQQPTDFLAGIPHKDALIKPLELPAAAVVVGAAGGVGAAELFLAAVDGATIGTAIRERDYLTLGLAFAGHAGGFLLSRGGAGGELGRIREPYPGSGPDFMASAAMNEEFRSLARQFGVRMRPQSGELPVFRARVNTMEIDFAQVDIGTLTDEYTHIFNTHQGRGTFLDAEARQAHLASFEAYTREQTRVALGRQQGINLQIDPSVSRAFHQLEVLNFLESGAHTPSFVRPIRSELHTWAQGWTDLRHILP